jgi:hypothetical protein
VILNSTAVCIVYFALMFAMPLNRCSRQASKLLLAGSSARASAASRRTGQATELHPSRIFLQRRHVSDSQDGQQKVSMTLQLCTLSPHRANHFPAVALRSPGGRRPHCV